MKVYYSPDYVGAAYGFDTTRKAAWIADSLVHRPIDGVELLAPPPLTAGDLERVHDREYVRAVRTGEPSYLAESQGFAWDPALWPMVLASNGGVLAAARNALDDGVAGSLSSGLHHAKRDRGDGFCTFNGLVVAAKTLLDEGAVSSVLILDLDAHCGGGTAQLIDRDPRIWHEDVSVSAFDHYSGHTNSAPWDVDHADDYLLAVKQAVAQADRLGPFDLCLYNAGMDPYQGCGVGGLDGITAEILAQREQNVFDWCRQRRIPIAFVLAGGYIGSRLDQTTLVDLHRLTVAEGARMPIRV
ncbi:acetoin utilization protein AcuC [Rhodococcus sp. Br-6]|nr:acetoin utilization protein AcuC [Rhodococcus sp. Br-6]